MKAGISSPARVHHGFHLSVIRDPVHHVALYAVNSDLLASSADWRLAWKYYNHCTIQSKYVYPIVHFINVVRGESFSSYNSSMLHFGRGMMA